MPKLQNLRLVLQRGCLPSRLQFDIVLEHYRLGSSRVILSRSFCDVSNSQDLNEIEKVFKENVVRLREFEQYAMGVNGEIYETNHQDVVKLVNVIVSKKRGDGKCC